MTLFPMFSTPVAGGSVDLPLYTDVAMDYDAGTPRWESGQPVVVTGLEADGALIPCNGVFILRQAVAPTDLLPTLETQAGYIKVDRRMATNVEGVFAAGDCTGVPLQVSKAVGEGHVAALSACEYLDQKPEQ